MADLEEPSLISTPEPAKRQRLDSTPTRTSSTSSLNRHDHPYLIRTTSSSLLTRSNSIGSVHKPPVHVSVTTNSPALGRSQGRGHKHTKSQNSVPVPLPLPPQSPQQLEKAPLSAASPSDVKQAFTASEGLGRLRRSDTLPSVHSSSPARSIRVEDLPNNPKAWTSTHLARYLSSALRVKGGGSLPAPVVRDIATFVVDQKLGGRAFLRLTQQDLEGMGMNQLWRPALLDASRVLRQNVVQGRIWGFGNTPEDIAPSPSSTRNSSTSGTSPTVAKNTHMPSVPSTVFEDHSDDGEAVSGPEDRYEGRNGWIARGMLTRSVSSLAASTSSIGRVRDMVANFERSASGSSASENDTNSANEISPFDFGSSNEAEQEMVLSPVHDEAGGFSTQVRRPLQDDTEVGGDDAGFASGELTSGSEAGDEDDGEDDVFGGDKIKTVSEEAEDLPASHSGSDGEEINAPEKDEDSSKESDASPTSSSLPQTPPPVYETHPIGLVTPSETEMTLHEDETTDDFDTTSPKRHTHSRSPSSTLMLTSSQRRNPSFVAQISHDSGSDDTIENLIADFTAAELEQHPMVASWGANAWLDDNVKEGATARKINEPVYHSLSRRTGKTFRSQESSSGSGSSKLMSLFEDPALDKKTADASVDASRPEGNVESQKIKELEEHQVRQQALLDEFRTRLEEVERRLEEMEAKEAEREERERALAATPESVTAAKTELSPALEQANEVITEEETHIQELPSEDKGKAVVKYDGQDWDDPTIGGLPSYVFLVGLGVAAICMRVVVKRVVGKKTPGMLGFL